VTDDDAGIGDEALDSIGGGLDVVDSIVDEEYLAFTGEFSLDRLFDALFVVWDDLGDDGSAVEWGGGE